MSYVPPALRRKQEAAASQGESRNEEGASSARISESTAHLRSLKDIQKHFWPNWVPEIPIVAPKHNDDHASSGSINHGLNDVVQSVLSTDKNSDFASTKSPEVAALNLNASSMLETSTKPHIERTTSRGRVTNGTEILGSASADSSHHLPSVKHNEQGQSDTTDIIPKSGKQEDRSERGTGTHRSGPSDPEPVHPHNTLNDTEEAQGSLQYVLLFHDANPRWPKDQIVYVKSALELLPAPQTDQQGPLAKHIMVFEQQNAQRTASSAMFSVIGYFNLVNMQILEPQTPELVRMQEQKWTRTDRHGRPRPINRNAESWKKSLTQRWAVLKFEKDEEATKELQPPQIEASSTRSDAAGSSGQERKGVNEMLKEMRLKDGT